MSSYLTPVQIEKLLAPINPVRVLERDGMSYVEAHDVVAHLTRIFGFGRWSFRVTKQEIVHREQVTMRNGKPGWHVICHTVGLLTVCAPDGTVLAEYEEGHTGDNTGPSLGDVMGNAVTNSESYALKRCAKNLGDAFGLSLYAKGSKQAIVKGTLVGAPKQGGALPEPDPVRPEREEHPEPPAPRPVETNRPKPPAPAPQPPAPPKRDSGKAQDLADQALAVQGSAKDRMVALTKLELAAITAGVKDQQVTRADGKQMPLYELIKECIAHSRIGRAS